MEKLLSLAASRDQTLEKAFLSGLLAHKSIPAGVVSEMFVGSEKKLFDAIKAQWDQHHEIDPDLLVDASPELILECAGLSPDVGEVALAKLRTHAMQRQIANSILCIDTNEDPQVIARYLQDRMSSVLLSASHETPYNHTQEIQSLLTTLEESARSEKNIAGISTGIPELDIVLNGFERGKFYILAALKKTGKSRFMVHIAIKLHQSGCRVLMNSLEMSRTQLNSCALGWFSDLNTRQLGTRLPVGDYHKMSKGFSDLSTLNWCVYREKTVPELRARVYQESSKQNVDFVFVDFLQRMRGVKAKDRVREVEEISMDLADMSRDMGVGVIALCQLSGAAERLEEDQIPDMSYVKESQGAAENADSIIVMHNPNRKATKFEDGKYVSQEIWYRVEQRYGLSGHAVKALGDLRTCRFFSMPSGGESNQGPGDGDGWGEEKRNPRLPYTD
jgi:replicative DNA helicase